MSYTRDVRLILASLLFTATASAETLQIDDTAFATIHAPVHVISDDGSTTTFELADTDVPALSETMHHEFHRCGGFFAYDSLADAQTPVHVNAPAVSYTLDHPNEVTSVLASLSDQRIATTIGELSAMPNRFYRTAAGAEASNYLAERWRSFATRPGVTVQLVDHGFPQKSVILTIPGTTRADEVIVLGGHLDSIAMGGLSKNAPGADDDASGIATLTEIARGLLAADYRPERTIKLIAYEAEEVGLVGSQAIVKDFQRAHTNVVGVLQLDMTNYKGSDRDIWLMKDFTSAAQNAFLEQLIIAYTGATYGTDSCGYACSDHASWTKAGVPASMPFESRMKQYNPQIHSARDTLAQSNNEATHALKFAKLGAAFAIELGKGKLGGNLDRNSEWKLLALGALLASLIAGRKAMR